MRFDIPKRIAFFRFALLVFIIINALFLINRLPTKFTIYPTMLHFVKIRIIGVAKNYIQCIIYLCLALNIKRRAT